MSQDIDAGVRERENHSCCLTGVTENIQPTHIVAPSFLDDDDLRSEVGCPIQCLLVLRVVADRVVLKGRLRPLLNASISAKLTEQLETFLRSSNQQDRLSSAWLFSPSAQHDFRHGHVEIRRWPFYGRRYDFSDKDKTPGQKVCVSPL